MLDGIDEALLRKLERDHREGLTSAEILSFLEIHGVKFSEATLRKYVQVGILPRSIRVGRKGKHRGSQGVYPATVVRQILRIKEMMADDLTIEQIQREFLFVRGDLDELRRLVAKIFDAFAEALRDKADVVVGRVVASEVAGAKSLAEELASRLESIEAKLTARAKVVARQQAAG